MSVTQQERLHDMIGVFFRIWRLHGHVLDAKVADKGIFKSQIKMLAYISRHEGVSQKELAKVLEISAPSIAVTAKRLEKMGFIVRRMDEKDNRVNILNTTEAGREVLSQTWSTYEKIDISMFDDISEDDLEVMERCLIKMEENLNKNL